MSRQISRFRVKSGIRHFIEVRMKWVLPGGGGGFTGPVYVPARKIVTFTYADFADFPEEGAHVWLSAIAWRSNPDPYANRDESLRTKNLILDYDLESPMAVCKAKIRSGQFKLDFMEFKD